MPLSEEELRALEQMERALVQEDPKLASTLRGTNLRRAARRRAILAGVCFVVGIGVLMAGAIGRITLVGILGFVVMLASATVGLAALRGTSSARQPAVRRRSSRPARCSTGSAPRGAAATTTKPEPHRRRPRRRASREPPVSRAPTGQPTWSTTPPAATASGSRSRSARAAARGHRRTASAGTSGPGAASLRGAAVLQRRDAGAHVLGQRAGNVVGVPGVAHPLQGEHDPVERVLGPGRQPAPRGGRTERGAVRLGSEPGGQQVARLVR